MNGWLRRFPIASELTDADAELLERVCVVSRHPSDHVLVREGDRADGPTAAMYFLLEGRVGVVAKAPEGGFGVRRTLEPGQSFGALALTTELPRTATCRAIGPVTVARLDKRTFQALFHKNAGLHARFQLFVARTLAADLRALRALLVASAAKGDEAALRDRFGS